jgi:hypothetical protein
MSLKSHFILLLLHVFPIRPSFYRVLYVKANFICMFLNIFVICLTSLPQYMKVAHFVVWCLGSVCMFCFGGCSGFSVRFSVIFILSKYVLIVFFPFVLIFWLLGMCVIDLVGN